MVAGGEGGYPTLNVCRREQSGRRRTPLVSVKGVGMKMATAAENEAPAAESQKSTWTEPKPVEKVPKPAKPRKVERRRRGRKG